VHELNRFSKRHLSIGLALGLLIFSAILMSLANTDVAQARPELQAGPNPDQSPCVVDIRQRARPDMLLLGETTSVTITVKPTCAGARPPMHIVLVLDASGSMGGGPTQQMKDAAYRLLDLLDLPNHPDTRVGVVEFNSFARPLCQLTNVEGRVRGCINKVGAGGGTSIQKGLTEGLKVTRTGRNAFGVGKIFEMMIVLTDGEDNEGCQPVIKAAKLVKDEEILVASVCLGGGCDRACMRQVASSTSYFYSVDNPADLLPAFEGIAASILSHKLFRMTLVAELPEDMIYLENSSQPPSEVSADRQRLEWQQSFVPEQELSFSFDVRPQKLGFRRLTTGVILDFVDLVGRGGQATARPAWVSVFGPFSPPPNHSPPTPIPTLTPTPTPTP
jgi:uncharacterized protein YegL